MTQSEAIKEFNDLVEGIEEYRERARQYKYSNPKEWERMNERRIVLINSGLIPMEMWFHGQGYKGSTEHRNSFNGERI